MAPAKAKPKPNSGPSGWFSGKVISESRGDLRSFAEKTLLGSGFTWCDRQGIRNGMNPFGIHLQSKEAVGDEVQQRIPKKGNPEDGWFIAVIPILIPCWALASFIWWPFRLHSKAKSKGWHWATGCRRQNPAST